MNKLQDKKIAIVCDWLKDFWWAELVISHLIEAFPNADIFTSVFFMENNPIFKWKNVKTSFIQKIPFLNKSHKLALTIRPYAFESFDLSQYDIVISSASAESKWIITKPETLHFCYCHTPTRYFWSHYNEYINIMFIKRKINSFIENIDYYSNHFFKFIKENYIINLNELNFSVIWLDSYGVCFFEKNSNIKFDILDDGFRIFNIWLLMKDLKYKNQK